jgi:uncharacterized membrane protein
MDTQIECLVLDSCKKLFLASSFLVRTAPGNGLANDLDDEGGGMLNSANSSKTILWKRGFCKLLALPFIFLPAWEAEGKLKKGQSSDKRAHEGVRIEEVTNDRTETHTTMRIRVLTDAPAGKTWTVLQDLERWHRFTKFISRIAPLDTEGTETRYSLSVSPPWPISDFDAVLRVEKRPEERQILWKMGRAEETEKSGIISVQETDGGTRVTSEIHGAAIPNWVMKIGVNLILPSVLDKVYREIREHG